MHVVVIRGARGYSHRHLVKGPGELCTLGILPIGYIASRAFVGVRLIRDVPVGEYPQCAQR